MELEPVSVEQIEDKREDIEFARENIIQPLLDKWKYIKVKKIGRNRYIELTEEGRKAAEVLS